MANNWIVGGKGDMSGSNTNGGGFVIGGTATYTDCQGINGGPTSESITWNGSQTACTLTDLGATTQITRANGFDNCRVGSMAYVDFNVGDPSGDSITNDWYEVLTVDVEVGFITIDLADIGSSTHCDVHVGGAFAQDGTGIAQGLSLSAAGDEVHLATNPVIDTDYDVAATITVPATAGTSANKITIKGVNYIDGSDLLLTDSRPTWNAVDGLGANPILLLDSGVSEYYKWENMVFDGNDISNYCVYNSVSGTHYHIFDKCRFRQATSHGIFWHGGSYYLNIVDCRADNNGGHGFYSVGARGIIEFSFANDNIENGFDPASDSKLTDCLSYNNENGYRLLIRTTLTSCNGHGNGNGLYIDSTRYWNSIINCSFTNNDTYGINLNGITTSLIYMSNNHSYNNGTAHYSEGADGTWADAFDGDNITGDPKFISVIDGSEDFDLEWDSPLQRTGINNTTIGAGTRFELSQGFEYNAYQAIYIQEEDVS